MSTERKHRSSPNDAQYDPVSASTWTAQELNSSHVPYAAPASVPIQFGLLTAQEQRGPLPAQGSYMPTLDWPSDQTCAPDTIALLDQHTGLSVSDSNFDLIANDDRLPLGSLPDGTDLSLTQYDDIYGSLVAAPYQNAHFDPTTALYEQATLPSLSNVSEGYAPHSTHAPYQGIWAFNPMSIDENFVYPTSQTQAPTGRESSTIASQPLNPTSLASATPVTMAQMNVDPNALGWTTVASGTISPGTTSTHTAFSTTSPPQNGSSTTQSARSSQSHPHPHSHPHSPSMPSRPKSITPPRERPQPPVAPGKPKSSKPERAKKNKTAQNQLAPRRQGPLSTAQRQKADDMRYYGACWRCRRYKKPCNGPGTCDTCLTSGFRVWPSSVGCYRGNMEAFIIGVMPGNAELIVNGMDFAFPKVPNWRTHFGWQPDMFPMPQITGPPDKWQLLVIKLRATRIAGRGFVELMELLADYQRSRAKPDTCLELTCSALNHICDIYHAFITTDTEVHLDAPSIISALTLFRATYSDCWRHFLQHCLSGRRQAWFPAFLCACVNVQLLSILKDAFVAIPEPARTSLWPNISFLIEDLRNRLYPMGLDLLSALAKGIKPWKLRCWSMKETVGPDGAVTWERDPDGMRFLAGDKGAFDGFAAVQSWLARNEVDMYAGTSFLTTPPFSQKNAMIQPVAALAWIFEVKPPEEPVSSNLEHSGAAAGAA